MQHFADSVFIYEQDEFTPEELKLVAAQRKMFLDMRVKVPPLNHHRLVVRCGVLR